MKAVEFGKYIRYLRKQANLTIRQLELYSGVSNAYLSQLENGKRNVPSPEILRKLSGPLKVPYEELMAKAGYLVTESSDHSNGDRSTDRLRQIPIVAEIPCGAPVFTEDNIIGSFPVDTSIVKLTGGDYVWVRAKGDSMVKAGIKDGSLVLIRLQPDVEDKDIAAVCVDQENATLKRIKFDEDNIILIPENDDMYPSSYAKERIRIVGKAVRVVAEL
jgi:repressor LexA